MSFSTKKRYIFLLEVPDRDRVSQTAGSMLKPLQNDSPDSVDEL